MSAVAHADASDDGFPQIVVEPVVRDEYALRALATLRTTVFRSWPYLYQGSADYESAYLYEFLSDEEAVLIVARFGEIAVGMATASPLAGQSDAIKAPFLAARADVGRIFYFGESVLLPQFRGMGIGNRFFDEREAAARAAGATHATFCAVARESDHPLRPADVRDLTPFWTKRGYRLAPRFQASLSWTEVGGTEETPHLMRFWAKNL